MDTAVAKVVYFKNGYFQNLYLTQLANDNAPDSVLTVVDSKVKSAVFPDTFFGDVAYGWGNHADRNYVVNPMTSKGDMITTTNGINAVRVKLGDRGTVLTSYGDMPEWMELPQQAEQIQSDWAQTTAEALDFIKNKPTLGPISSGGYPGAGIPISTGSAWNSSIADHSSNWNAAYGWGNHGLAGYMTNPMGNSGDMLTMYPPGGDPMDSPVLTVLPMGTSGQYLTSYIPHTGSPTLRWATMPTIPPGQIQSNWTQTNGSSLSYILNKPTNGQIKSDWFINDTNSIAWVRNRPLWIVGTPGNGLSHASEISFGGGVFTFYERYSLDLASTSTTGALSSSDWNTFNGKGNGTITSVTGTSPVISSGGTAPAISMSAATTSANGYLTSTDWNLFNNKVSSRWTGTTDIYRASGKVGIGNTSQDSTFHVTGSSHFTGNMRLDGYLGIGTTAPVVGRSIDAYKNGSATIAVTNTGGAGGATYRMYDVAGSSEWFFKATSAGFKIRDNLANSTAGYDVMTIQKEAAANCIFIKAGGNIGIGMTTPTEKIEVLGNIANQKIKLTAEGGYAVLFPTSATLAAGDVVWEDPANGVVKTDYYGEMPLGVCYSASASSFVWVVVSGLTTVKTDGSAILGQLALVLTGSGNEGKAQSSGGTTYGTYQNGMVGVWMQTTTSSTALCMVRPLPGMYDGGTK